MTQDIYTYLHQLQQALQTQQAAILNLEEQVRQLQEELNELKNRPSSSVGKVDTSLDYSFIADAGRASPSRNCPGELCPR